MYHLPKPARSCERGIQPELRIDEGLREKYEMWHNAEEEKRTRKQEEVEDDDE